MKNITAIIITFVIMATIAFTACHSLLKEYDIQTNTHTERCVVVETIDDMVYVETTDGNIYSFYGNGFEDKVTIEVVFEDGQIIEVL